MIDYESRWAGAAKNVIDKWSNDPDELIVQLNDVVMDAWNEGWNEGRTELKAELIDSIGDTLSDL